MERFFKRSHIRISIQLKITSRPYAVPRNSTLSVYVCVCVCVCVHARALSCHENVARKLYKRVAVAVSHILSGSFDETAFCRRPVAKLCRPPRLLFQTFSKNPTREEGKGKKKNVQLETNWLKFG